MSRIPPAALIAAVLACAACFAPAGGHGSASAVPEAPRFVPDLPVSTPPFGEVHASWKQRLDQPYVFLEHRGSYADTGPLIATLHREMVAQGLTPSGPPFALFYADPARVPVEELVSRACMPVAGARSPQSPLRYDVLPSTTVVYGFASGPYPELPRAYPGLFRHMRTLGWVQHGPVREIYVVPPADAASYAELLAEIQIPARGGR